MGAVDVVYVLTCDVAGTVLGVFRSAEGAMAPRRCDWMPPGSEVPDPTWRETDEGREWETLTGPRGDEHHHYVERFPLIAGPACD